MPLPRPCLCGAAFLPAPPLAPRRARATAQPRGPAMRLSKRGAARRKGGARRGAPRGPLDAPEGFEAIGEEYGVRKARPGQALDEKVARDAAGEGGGGYAALVGVVGQARLDAMEKVVFVALAGIFAAFLASGLAISSLAAFKATDTPVPEGWDEFLTNNVEGAFTPSLVVFFALSSFYGLYKQAQLNAGTTGYKERQGK